jgi:acyl-homoserine-lactone acylase
VLFKEWFDAYSSGTRRRFRVAWSQEQPFATPTGLGDPEQAVSALSAAVKATLEKYGTLDVRWGDVHRFRRGNLDLALPGIEGWYGSFRTINYRKDEKGKSIGVGGDGYILAVEFTDPPKGYSILAYSQSSNPESKHYNDQAQLFVRGEFKPTWFTEQDIKAHLERSYRPGED